MNLQENIRRILKEERNISDIIKIVAKEYNCSTWEINNGYCEDFALNVLEKLGGYEDNLFELSGDMFFNQRDPEFAKENWGDVIETNYGVWSKNLLDYWGYPPNVNLNLVDDEINHVWLFYNGKHYDAEVPEGVDNWFEIPLIKRLFNRYKKNMVQENIRKILKEENLKQSLKQQIRDFGWMDAAELVGGVDELFSIMNFKSPMEFLHIFDGMEVVQSEEEDWDLFRYVPRNNLMIEERRRDRVYISYVDIWGFLKTVFKLEFTEIQELTKRWLDEAYNLRVVSTHHNLLSNNIGTMRSTI
jgi:hypothetical protein